MQREARLSSCTGRPIHFGLYAVVFLVFLYGPILLMPVFSFNDSIFATFPLKGFTFSHYETMVERRRR